MKMGNYMNFTVKAAAAGAISAAALALSAPAATAAIPGNPMSTPTCANQQVVLFLAERILFRQHLRMFRTV